MNHSIIGGSGKGSPSKKASSSTLDHTVIPFSIAIKRMSEILIYKANECKAKVGIGLLGLNRCLANLWPS